MENIKFEIECIMALPTEYLSQDDIERLSVLLDLVKSLGKGH